MEVFTPPPYREARRKGKAIRRPEIAEAKKNKIQTHWKKNRKRKLLGSGFFGDRSPESLTKKK
jgi:hypothetical protein